VPLVGLLVFVGLALVLEHVLAIDTPVGVVGGTVLALVPALLWLSYFFLLDRRQPEPTHYVLSMFLLGALVAAPVSGWLLDGPLGMGRWVALGVFSPVNVALAFLAVGAAQELTKYLVVRYTVFLTVAFDERADGIVYGTAAGVGFAAALNLRHVAEGVFVGGGAVELTVTTLAHGCFAGAMGYALGQARFASGRRAQIYEAAGLLAAIGLNGGFYLLRALVTRPGLELRPLHGLLLSVAYAAGVFAVVLALMRRSLRQDAVSGAPPVKPTGPLPGGLLDVVRRADLVVLLLGAALLAAGWGIKARYLERGLRYQSSALSIRYPSGWMQVPETPAVVLVDVLASDTFKPRVVIVEVTGAAPLEAAAVEGELHRLVAAEGALLHVLDARSEKLRGRRALRLEYAFAHAPGGGVPTTVRGTLLAFEVGDKMYTVRVEQSEAGYREDPGLARRILSSLRAGP
jgi:RsiW-degrading membrane proteinase PrsW (M82 family)